MSQLCQACLLWLWSRGGKGATTTGDEEAIALLRKVLVDVFG